LHEGVDVKSWPLRDRLSILDVAFIPSTNALLCHSFPGPVTGFEAGVRSMGGEGVIAKRLDRPYQPGRRTGAWVKKRLNIGQEFVICGYTLGSKGFDALIVGYYRGEDLVYVARVRVGFVPASRRFHIS
jgi:ATP-dependent DNA ligase